MNIQFSTEFTVDVPEETGEILEGVEVTQAPDTFKVDI